MLRGNPGERRHLGRGAIILLLAAVLAPSLAPGPSGAALTVELGRDVKIPPDGHFHRLTELKVFLPAGDSYYLSGRVALRSTTNYSMLAKVRILCREPEGAPSLSRGYIWTTRNHLGRDSTKRLVLRARHLITATASGEYTCELSTRSYRLAGDKPYLVALAGYTYLTGGDEPEQGAKRWALEDDYGEVRHVLDPNGILVGPDPGRRIEHLLRKRWEAHPLAEEMKAVGDLEVTVCYYHTASCPSYAWGRRADRWKGSVVKTRLSATQLDEDGLPCAAVTRDPPSDYRRTFVSSGAHHQKIHHTLIAPVSRDPSCTRQFLIRIVAHWGGPNPVRVEPRPYTIGIAMNRFLEL